QRDAVRDDGDAAPAQLLDGRGQRASWIEVLGQQLDKAQVPAAVDEQSQFRPPADAKSQEWKRCLHQLPHPPQPPPPQPPPPPQLLEEPQDDVPQLPHEELPDQPPLFAGGGRRAVGNDASGPPARTPVPNKPMARSKSSTARRLALRPAL